jgi:hypothetical protein
MKFRVFWDALPCSQIDVDLMVEAARTSEISVDIVLRTQQDIPEDSELQLQKLPMPGVHRGKQSLMKVKNSV